MSVAIYPSLFFTVVLMVTTMYFLLGGLPLLILEHDTPTDGRFVRRFFDIYYKAALFGAAGGCLSYALWGRAWFALGGAVIVGLVLLLRSRILPAMEQLNTRIHAHADAQAIRSFRKLHSAALLANVAQMVLLVWGVLHITL
jgi:hypothetical protein